jgi:hypothetical protein
MLLWLWLLFPDFASSPTANTATRDTARTLVAVVTAAAAFTSWFQLQFIATVDTDVSVGLAIRLIFELGDSVSCLHRALFNRICSVQSDLGDSLL